MHVIALGCALTATLAPADEIAFVDAAAGEGGAVCLISAEGGEARQIGPGKQDGAPRWSPDGAWLAFETASPAGRGIYLVRADGTEGRIVGTGDWSTAPAWSPDGTRLTYSSAPVGGPPGPVRVLDLNSGDDTAWGNSMPGIVQPVWMPFTGLMLALDPEQSLEVPDVNMTALRSEARMNQADLKSKTLPEAILGLRLSPDLSGDRPTVRTDIVLITRSQVLPLMSIADSERAARLATVLDAVPNWIDYELEVAATAGRAFGNYSLVDPGETTRIAFESNEGGDREIMILGRRGVANISNHRAADWNPVWSPDGDNLAFESFRGGFRGIYDVFADTAHVTPLAAKPGVNCWSPAWSPDGAHLAFIADGSGQAEIYIAGPREKTWTLLTSSGGPKATPAWRPVRQ